MDIAQKLRSEGYKVTPQRIAIYQVLYGQNEHPTAEMIYQSLATVYKTMEIFEKIGLVKVLDIGDDSSRYDWDTHNHPHMRCSICNRIDDLHDMNMEDTLAEVEALSHYKVTGQQITFEGICPDCLRKGTH